MTSPEDGARLDRIRAVARLLDEPALVALANKGLVRRARADLATAPPTLIGPTEHGVALRAEGWTVELRERPADSRCECPTSSRCRHILTAWLFLAAQAPAVAAASPAPASASASAGAELLAVDDEALRRWAGAALVRRAQRELAGGLTVSFSDGAVFVARLPELSVECRWLPGAGPAGMLCDCHAETACLHRVATVLAWQVAGGVRQLDDRHLALEASAEAPRTRQEVRLAVASATEELVAQGLSRLAPSLAARLRTLATSAHGVDLPRLERVLRGLADEIAAWLTRSARASDDALLLRCATAHALSRALARPTAATIGQHRSRYDRVREIELVGVGAHVWRTASGYRGLTVYFWDVAAATWNSWSEARPVATPDFDPNGRFGAPGPWEGCESPAIASRGHLRLRGAHRSRGGRLSGRAGATVVSLEAGGTASLPAPTTDWSELAQRARGSLVSGLGDSDEQSRCVLLQPATWGRAQFDPLAQELRLPLRDRAGRTIALTLEQTPENLPAMAALEALSADAERRVFGLLTLRRGALAVTPISVIDAREVSSLGLASTATIGPSQPLHPRADEASAPDERDGEDELDGLLDDADAPPDSSDPVGRCLAESWRELEAVAAAGPPAYHHWERFAGLARRAETLGLAEAARLLQRVEASAHDDSAERARRVARALLDAAWVVRLTESAVVVERAAATVARTDV